MKKDAYSPVATRQDIDDLAGAVSRLAASVDNGFGRVENRLDSVETHLGSVKERLDNIEATTNQLESKLAPTIERVDDLSVRVGEHGANTA